MCLVRRNPPIESRCWGLTNIGGRLRLFSLLDCDYNNEISLQRGLNYRDVHSKGKMATPFNPDDIHLGVWTNWSYGPTRGSTLTLSRDHGALLTAFIAMFVGYAGTRAWRLICWVLHLSISSDLPSNAVYHQRQNILRNSSSGDAAFWDFLFVSWAWRRILRRKVMTNVLPLLILSASLSLLFAAAGIFSSQISRAMVGFESHLKAVVLICSGQRSAHQRE